MAVVSSARSLAHAHRIQECLAGAHRHRLSKRQPKPVARVNGSVLTDADLVREEYAIFPYARQHKAEFPRTWPRRFATAP